MLSCCRTGEAAARAFHERQTVCRGQRLGAALRRSNIEPHWRRLFNCSRAASKAAKKHHCLSVIKITTHAVWRGDLQPFLSHSPRAINSELASHATSSFWPCLLQAAAAEGRANPPRSGPSFSEQRNTLAVSSHPAFNRRAALALARLCSCSLPAMCRRTPLAPPSQPSSPRIPH